MPTVMVFPSMMVMVVVADLSGVAVMVVMGFHHAGRGG